MKKIFQKKIVWLLLACGGILLIVFLENPAKFWEIWQVFQKLVWQLVPVLGLVFLIMFLVNYFLNKKKLEKLLLEKSSTQKWFVSIFAGILSVGPVYAWYPLMQDLQKKGVEDRYIASFLYNRGIKLQWATVLIFYFGLTYTLVLFVVMTVFSIPQGIIAEKLIDKFSLKRVI